MKRNNQLNITKMEEVTKKQEHNLWMVPHVRWKVAKKVELMCGGKSGMEFTQLQLCYNFCSYWCCTRLCAATVKNSWNPWVCSAPAPQLDQMAKTHQKLDPNIREIDWSHLCLEQFDKFWICSVRHDRKWKLFGFLQEKTRETTIVVFIFSEF